MNCTTKSTIIKTDISDHYPIALICNGIIPVIKNVNDKQIPIFKRDTRESNIRNMRTELSATDWSDVFRDNNVQSAFTTFNNVLCDIFYRNCPMRRLKSKKKLQKSPWITSGILKSIRKKNILYCAYKRDPTDQNLVHYRVYKNMLTRIVRNVKKSYYNDYFHNNKSNSKQIWAGIN